MRFESTSFRKPFSIVKREPKNLETFLLLFYTSKCALLAFEHTNSIKTADRRCFINFTREQKYKLTFQRFHCILCEMHQFGYVQVLQL